MEETRYISADMAEQLIPNTLIQSIIASIHRKRIDSSPTRRGSSPGNQLATSGEQELAWVQSDVLREDVYDIYHVRWLYTLYYTSITTKRES